MGRYDGQFVAIGFVGDYRGGSDNFETFLPVLEISGGIDDYLYVPHTERWTSVADLKLLTPSDRQYVHHLPEPSFAEPGALIAVAGLNFVNRCSRLPALERYGSAFRSYWGRLGPYTYKVTDKGAFEEIQLGILQAAGSGLLESFREGSRASGSSYDNFSIINGLIGLSPHDTWIYRGVYAYETSDFRSHKLYGESLVQDGIVGSMDEYCTTIEEAVEFLKKQRFSDTKSPMMGHTFSTHQTRSDAQIFASVIQGYRGYWHAGLRFDNDRIEPDSRRFG